MLFSKVRAIYVPSRCISEIRAALCCFVLAFLTAGCGQSKIVSSHPHLAERAVFLDQDGEAFPVDDSSGCITEGTWEERYEDQIECIADAIVQDDAPNGIMVIVHGGLAAINASSRYSEQVSDSIAAAGYSPVMLNWRSDAFDSYAEHVHRVYQGRVVGPNVMTVPLVAANLVSDVGRGVTRLPLTASTTVTTLRRGSGWRSGRVEYDSLRGQYGSPDQVQVSIGEYNRTPLNKALGIWRFPFLPVQMAASGLSDAFGTPSWENMRRRTRTMFRQPREFRTHRSAEGASYRPGTGGAAILLDRLVALQRSDSLAGRPPREITLVGHSMGAIILNEAVRAYPDLHFTDIVYMAAAASIRDMSESVIPYLEDNPDARFYNLTLHPQADANEQALRWLPIVPTGSLLEWIDAYYATPETFLDRTLGKWANIMEATHIFPDAVRGQVTIKAFGVNDPCQPTYGSSRATPEKHGSFNDPDLGFWRRDFWEAIPPGEAECRRE